MDKVVGKAKEAMGKKEDNFGKPGNNAESKADDAVNNQVNSAADNAGLPQEDNKFVDKFVDNKVNSEIPGGN